MKEGGHTVCSTLGLFLVNSFVILYTALMSPIFAAVCLGVTAVKQNNIHVAKLKFLKFFWLLPIIVVKTELGARNALGREN